ncbi:unnamed protein product [Ixodes hexagonus]
MTTSGPVSRYWLLLIATTHCLASAHPNIVVLLADDLGIGDVGCFGNDTISTPNIDKLAKSGALLTQHMTAAAVCTPSRAALLTGRYPVRSGMESHFKNKVFIILASSGGLPPNETTFAKLLQQQGYATGFFGKKIAKIFWYISVAYGNEPLAKIPKTCLTDSWGTPDKTDNSSGKTPSTLTYCRLFVSRLYVAVYVRRGADGALTLLQTFYNQLRQAILVQSNVQCITVARCQMQTDLMLCKHPLRTCSNEFRVQSPTDFSDADISDISKWRQLHLRCVHQRRRRHSAVPPVINQIDKHMKSDQYKAEVAREFNIDIKEVEGGQYEARKFDISAEIGFSDCLIIRTIWESRGKTMGGWEGGIRVPTVVSWPRHVPAGLRVDAATSQMDMLPTVLHLAGLEPPKDRTIDGTSLLPLLHNEMQSSPHEFLFHYCGNDVHAVRYIPRDGSGVWKVHFHSSDESQCPYVCHCYGSYVLHHDPPLVFHLDTDPSERNPLSPSSDPRVHKVVAAARDALRGHTASLEVLPQQFNFLNTFWLPWLQPCCNFPRCSCREEDDTLL